MKRFIVFLILCCMMLVPAYAASDNGIIDIACGNGTCFVLMEDGKLIAWGDNSAGFIPSAGRRSKIKFDERRLITTNASAIELGGSCAYMIDKSNTLYGWGEDGKASLLCGTADGGRTSEPVKLLDGICRVSCGTEHNAAITLDGELCTWGTDTNGSLGQSVESERTVSQPRTVLKHVRSVCCLGNDTAAIDSSGVLYAWGESFGCSAPRKIGSGMADVRRGCGGCFILKNEANEMLLMYCVPSEDGTPSVELSAPVASNVSELTDYGYIRDDGTLWMSRSQNGNTFVPSAENVRLVECSDMRYRMYLTDNALHTDSFELDKFKNSTVYRISTIDVPIVCESDGVIRSIVLGVILAAVFIIAADKPPFYLRLRERFLASVREELDQFQYEEIEE